MKDALEGVVASELDAIEYDLVDLRRGGTKSRPLIEVRIDRRDGSAVTVDDCARASRALEARFDRVPQFNAWTITAPRGSEDFHWHLDIAPRIGIRAGFEMSTGVELNVFPPERAASELRDALG